MDDQRFIRSFEGFHNARFVGYAALALLVLGIVVGGLVAGFHGEDVARGADAMALVNAGRK